MIKSCDTCVWFRPEKHTYADGRCGFRPKALPLWLKVYTDPEYSANANLVTAGYGAACDTWQDWNEDQQIS